MSLSRIVDQPRSGPAPGLARHRRRRLIGGLALLTAVVTVLGTATAQAATDGAAPRPSVRHSAQPDFGPNVKIFDPSMPLAQIQATVDAIAKQQVGNQFGRERYALLFKPGTYGTAEHPLNFQVGYYTQVAGLGLSPKDVVIRTASRSTTSGARSRTSRSTSRRRTSAATRASSGRSRRPRPCAAYTSKARPR
jgi:hypothetical protein